MDDAGGKAEHRPCHHCPQGPQQRAGSGEICASGGAGEPEDGSSQHHGHQQEPGDATRPGAIEQSPDASAAAEARTTAPRTTAGTGQCASSVGHGTCGASATWSTATDRTDFVAGDPAKAVVAENQLPHTVGLRAADIGTGAGRRELHDRHPPSSRHNQRCECDHKVANPLAHTRWRGHEVGDGQRRQHEQRLQHLGHEAQPHENARQCQPGRGGKFDGPHAGVGSTHQQQDQ